MKYDIQTDPVLMQDILTIMIGSLLVARIKMGNLTTGGTMKVQRAVRRTSLKWKEKKVIIRRTTIPQFTKRTHKYGSSFQPNDT